MPAYYNEHDPYAAQWLRNLISAGAIAPGDVDERSISDVCPDDLKLYTQCHFFAGIGVWSAALREVGWPDDARIWTGSCPCQPFSEAGEGAGFSDERHLWPDLFHLVGQCEPAKIVGEQVASKLANSWVDLVRADMEGLGFAFGAVAFPAAGVGAPEIRDRCYWVADAERARDFKHGPRQTYRERGGGYERGEFEQPNALDSLGLADSQRERYDRVGASGRPQPAERGRPDVEGCSGAVIRLADADSSGREGGRLHVCERGSRPQEPIPRGCREVGDRPGPVNGHWRVADWLACTDGRWRPVMPESFPLAHGAVARVGRLRAYGNAIVLPQAVEFLRAALSDER